MNKLALIFLSLLLMLTPAFAQESDADDPDAAAPEHVQAPPKDAKAKPGAKDKKNAKPAKADKKAQAKPQAPVKQDPTGPYILIDAHTGEVLMEGRSGEPYYPASSPS